MREQHIHGAELLTDRIELLKKIGKHCITCEVGVAFGDFSREIVDIIQPKKHYMIDSWTYKGRYDEDAHNTVLKKFNYEITSGIVEIIRMDSIAGMVSLQDKSINFIYIDTDHTYKTTKKELYIANDKISKSGVIAGHDYKVGRFAPEYNGFIPYGVIEAVNEFVSELDYKFKYLTFEADQAYSFALIKR